MDKRPGRLVYVMGPSGAGKDTLLAYARARVDPQRVVFAHRYITRPADPAAENHVVLSPAEFAAREAAGFFALAWESHGFMYGLGTEIDLWRDCGLVVVVSGARGAWAAASQRYPDVMGVIIEAPADVRARRLTSRGRENAEAIRTRLKREIIVPASDASVHRLDNSGPVALAGDALVGLLQACEAA
ncbi:MAG TPA: phosphonate metabolism protein/1,5-bisphosphokinase (PRPP-forming) PhnN [Methylovirgula sp.]